MDFDNTTDRYKKRLLVVENEQGILDCIATALNEDFELTLAGSGEEAITHIHAAQELDLLVTDFSLGGPSDGFDVARAMRKKFPSAPIILMSGDSTGTPRIAAALALPDTRFLGKPFASTELKTAIDEMSRAD